MDPPGLPGVLDRRHGLEDGRCRAIAARPTRSPFHLYGAAAAAIGGITAGGLALGTSWPPLALYLAGVNAATLAVYGWDKRVAGTGGTRAPERLLHGLAFAGGTPAALVARIAFRHKTRKTGFRVWFWGILVLQAVAAWMLLSGRGPIG